MSLGAEAMNYLRSLVQSVCCIARKANPDPAIVGVTNLAFETAGNALLGPLSFAQANTSVEVENFAASDWILFVPTFATGSGFWIPPGGSKVIAVSTQALGGTYTIGVYDAQGGSNAVSEDFSVQITEISQP